MKEEINEAKLNIAKALEEVATLKECLSRYLELLKKAGFPDNIQEAIDRIEKMRAVMKECRAKLEAHRKAYEEVRRSDRGKI